MRARTWSKTAGPTCRAASALGSPDCRGTDISGLIRARLTGLPREQMTQAAMIAAYE